MAKRMGKVSIHGNNLKKYMMANGLEGNDMGMEYGRIKKEIVI